MLGNKIIFSICFICCIQCARQEANTDTAEKLYMKLFKRQRAEQLEAIKSFKKLSNYEKQYSMITLVAEKVFTVIQDSRATIEASSFIPGVSEFPLDDLVRDSLSNILENTALFSEIILRFPDVAVSVLRSNNNWDILLQWSIAFSSQVEYLLDKSTIKLLDIVSQELDYIERRPNYVNPYRSTTESQLEKSTGVGKKKKKKKQIKKGPRLSYHSEL